MRAEQRAREEAARFKGKPLYEKLQEEYEALKAKDDEDRKKKYDEETGKLKTVRPHQIITGEVVVKPPPKEPSPPKERPMVSGRSPGRGSPGRMRSLAQHGSPGAPPPPGAPGGDPDSPTAVRKPLEERSHKDKPRTQSIVLYSTRSKPVPAAHTFEERAVSPFIFNDLNQPVNVPDQMQFWHTVDGAQVMPVEMNMMEVIGEESDAPQMQSPTDREAEPEAEPSGLGDESLVQLGAEELGAAPGGEEEGGAEGHEELEGGEDPPLEGGEGEGEEPGVHGDGEFDAEGGGGGGVGAEGRGRMLSLRPRRGRWTWRICKRGRWMGAWRWRRGGRSRQRGRGRWGVRVRRSCSSRWWAPRRSSQRGATWRRGRSRRPSMTGATWRGRATQRLLGRRSSSPRCRSRMSRR